MVDCVARIKELVKDATAEEVDHVVSVINRRAKELQAEATLKDFDEALMRAAKDYIDDLKAMQIIEQRNSALNFFKRREMRQFLETNFKGLEGDGLSALLVGTNYLRAGARHSVDAQQKSLTRHYLQGLVNDLEKEGVLSFVANGELDLDIARELWLKDNPAGGTTTGNPRAQKAADVIYKWQEIARSDANRAGAWIKKLPGYITRQTHDIYKVRRAKFDTWKQAIMERLDWDATFKRDQAEIDTLEGLILTTKAQAKKAKGEAKAELKDTVKELEARRDEFKKEIGDPEKYLKKVYDALASGEHVKSGTVAGLRGEKNVGRSLSAERTLHFKDADAWFEYNKQFGTGNLRETVIGSLMISAQNTGLMRKLGPNAAMNFDRIFVETMEQMEADARLALGKHRKALNNQFAEVDGSAHVPGNHLAAQVGAGIRSVEMLSKLGMATISAIGDIPLYASEMKYQGRGMLSGTAEAIGGLMKGRGDFERRQLAGMLGIVSDQMLSTVATKFSGQDDIAGGMARTVQLFFKLNGLSWWTDSIRTSAALAMGHRLALNAGTAFADLDSNLSRVLKQFDITEADWDLLRQTELFTDPNGRGYMVPEHVQDLPDTAFGEATPAQVKHLKDQLEAKLRSYYVDRADFAAMTPDAKTSSIMNQGTAPGTLDGELWRFVMQFKAFPIAVIQKALGRETFGRGTSATSVGRALISGNGEFAGLAQLIALSTVFGYVAMAAKDLLKGREPRDPTQLKTVAAAALQGGALGIYGDFIFGDLKNRFGGGALSSLLGPTAGSFESVVDIGQRMRDGDDAAAKAFQTLYSHVPFVNLFYLKMALDYHIQYRVAEMISPGYVRRMEKRIEKEYDQQFLISPAEVLGR